ERQLCDYFGIKRGVLLYHFDWIKPLLDNLYNQLIHSFNEKLHSLTEPSDLGLVDLWAGVTELFLSDNLPIKDTFVGVFEFFSEHIPIYLHSHVLASLSNHARHRLFSTLAVLVVNE
uniref:hypothetical protein n=1 Tax=Pseudanabaena sp. 'Roaring Creek' TaxID=1681830 RepID=UPI000A6F7F73